MDANVDKLRVAENVLSALKAMDRDDFLTAAYWAGQAQVGCLILGGFDPKVMLRSREEWEALRQKRDEPETDELVCRGCYALGTACGNCSRCREWLITHPEDAGKEYKPEDNPGYF